MKTHSRPSRLLCLLAILCLSVVAFAQESGAISGRVVAEDGKPISNVRISLSSRGTGGSQSVSRSTASDEDGNFQFNNLPDRNYDLSISVVKGFIPAAGGQFRTRLRVGDNTTITMTKGGVITGRVTDPDGEPVVGINVAAMYARDQSGRKTIGQTSARPAQTDDRGIYRIYGLSPGKYIVGANAGPNFVAPALSPYYGETPTFHPSSTRDTAAEIEVVAGGEATGIDIRYRGEIGHIVSGKFSGLGESARAGVTLLDAQTGASVGNSLFQPNQSESGFAIHGVPDGEYELTASHSNSETEEHSFSEPRRVTVKGADVTGVVLRMIPAANIAGQIAVEKSPNVCDDKLKFSYEEIFVSAMRDEKLNASPGSPWAIMGRSGSINEKGEFKINGLVPGRYRLNANLPYPNWFVKSINASVLTARTAVSDLARNGLSLKSGEKFSGVTVTITDGGASLSGKVVGKEGATLPSRMMVHLVPAEQTFADDVLRYAERRASNGSFAFTNLAPGKYFLLARSLPDGDQPELPAIPKHLDATERAKLRKEAEAAKNEIELKPCQRVTEQILRYPATVK